MISPILNGFLVGLTLAFMIGPALFMLLQTSIFRGFKAGISFAFGVFLSDMMLIALVYLGISRFLGSDPRDNMWFNIIGGIILIIFGTITFTRKSNPEVRADVKRTVMSDSPSRPIVYTVKGFFLNMANPGVWFVWITAMVAVSASYSDERSHILVFFLTTLITVLSFDFLKAFLATKLSSFLSPTMIPKINKVIGVILCIVGVYLIVNLFYDLESMLTEHIDILNQTAGL